jgi:hypothetical protein
VKINVTLTCKMWKKEILNFGKRQQNLQTYTRVEFYLARSNCYRNLNNANKILRSVRTRSKRYKTEKRGIQKDIHINLLNAEITFTKKYSTNSYRYTMAKFPYFALPSKPKRYRKKLQSDHSDFGVAVGTGKGVARGRQKN